MVTKMMEYGMNKGLLSFAHIKNAVVAAKAGSTNDGKDGWLCGYSRYYTTAVWIGCDMPEEVPGLIVGSYPLNVWKQYMETIHEGLAKKNFPNYEGADGQILDGTKNDEEPTTEKETHPGGFPDADIDISDGDKDYNVDGMGDKDAPNKK